MNGEFIMVPKGKFADDLAKVLQPMIRQIIWKELKNYEDFKSLPESMKLSTAAKRTGISVGTLRKYANDGLIEIETIGEGRGKAYLRKSQIVKLFSKV